MHKQLLLSVSSSCSSGRVLCTTIFLFFDLFHGEKIPINPVIVCVPNSFVEGSLPLSSFQNSSWWHSCPSKFWPFVLLFCCFLWSFVAVLSSLGRPVSVYSCQANLDLVRRMARHHLVHRVKGSDQICHLVISPPFGIFSVVVQSALIPSLLHDMSRLGMINKGPSCGSIKTYSPSIVVCYHL